MSQQCQGPIKVYAKIWKTMTKLEAIKKSNDDKIQIFWDENKWEESLGFPT